MKRTIIPDISAVKAIAELNIRTLEHHWGSAVQLRGTRKEFELFCFDILYFWKLMMMTFFQLQN